MKIKLLLTAAGAACCAALGAAPLGVSTAVQSQPDASSPVITVLSAGAEQPAVSAKAGPAPAGWMAVDVPGPFVGYVKNKDLSKQLEVLPGASIYIGPKDSSGVLEVFSKGDTVVITGLHGGWTQVRLEKTLVGYVASGAPTLAPVDTASAAPLPAAPVSSAPSPAAMPAGPTASAPAPAESNTSLSQLFEGTLASSRSLLSPKRPFKWELVDSSGKLIAYIDLKDILLTDQIENYVGHQVVVLGTLRPVKETRDIVIDVEAFHLK
jgi:hypothetical protein